MPRPSPETILVFETYVRALITCVLLYGCIPITMDIDAGNHRSNRHHTIQGHAQTPGSRSAEEMRCLCATNPSPVANECWRNGENDTHRSTLSETLT